MKKKQETITVKEAAIKLHVSERTVHRMLKAGKLNAVQGLYEGHRQSFICINKKWKNEISKKQNKTAEEHWTALLESYEKAAKEHWVEASKYCVQAEDHATNAENQAIVAKDHADKAEADCCGARANADYARVQANTAKNASEDSNRYYLATKAFAEDAIKYRAQAADSVSKAKEEAQSALWCVIWCAIGTVISICGAIISLLK